MCGEKERGKIYILENTKEAQEKFGCACGASHYTITPEQIKALADGKQVAFLDWGGEYVSFISMRAPEGGV